MDLWFSEYHQDGVKLSINVDREIVSCQSDYQNIALFDSKEFGRILTLDGQLINTEKDEFFYSEMMVHVPMAVQPTIKDVLVIGGCDGGVLRELEKYESIETIDVVELDEQAIQICQEYFPKNQETFSDERITLYFQDGLKFVRGKEDAYDLVIVDTANPFGVNESLFTREFYGNCYKALREEGTLISQHANGFYEEDEEAFRHIRQRLTSVFPINKLYLSSVPSYAAGYLLFGYSAKTADPEKDVQIDVWENQGIRTRYYNTDVHRGAFCLPNYIKELL
ncbi:spermidine synthase [Enterococcus sp. DIV2402]|uniref:Polyamine aminopropyltransferase n=1 Tax=Candidatus Enterococcus lowellii TaxID=2230877 RepID=A0ABZ2SIJ6_9ENTE|nr:polyamine aminopropyltransferase [Enterococcus sp. DIV2402]MBO0464767.1 polyamine aminopropyltransferase [Enterococcus sp. DIV2402]